MLVGVAVVVGAIQQVVSLAVVGKVGVLTVAVAVTGAGAAGAAVVVVVVVGGGVRLGAE